eukprot:scaffold15396_cov140-Isochrysis_galbana.AAC.5
MPRTAPLYTLSNALASAPLLTRPTHFSSFTTVASCLITMCDEASPLRGEAALLCSGHAGSRMIAGPLRWRTGAPGVVHLTTTA